MTARLDAWSAKDREAFWTFVRGRAAERRLNQRQVADALGIDRAGLSRRYAGEIKERPDEWMVSQLADVLRSDQAEREQLRRLAGYAGPGGHRVPPDRAIVRVEAEPPDPDPASADPMPTAEPERLPRRRPTLWWLGAAGGAGFVILALVAVLLTRWLEPVRPGGVWAGPLTVEPASGRIHITARA